MMHIPSDNQEMTKKYLKEHGGICGQCCLAVIDRGSIEHTLENWQDMGLDWKGWSSWKNLRKYLENRSYNVVLKKRDGLKLINSDAVFYILRIQWIGEGDKKDKPFYGWGHWAEASSNTHFIVAHQGHFFCNEVGVWFKDLDSYFGENKGVVTSAMEIDLRLPEKESVSSENL